MSPRKIHDGPPDAPFPAGHRMAAGRVLDPGRLRSDGPLDATEVAFCREHGIPLAYDPVQIGWVTLDCVDDFGLDDAAFDPAPDSDSNARSASSAGAGRRVDSIRQQFEQQAAARLCDPGEARFDRARVEEAIWSLPEELLRGLASGSPRPAREQRDLLRQLQRRAVSILHEHVIPPEVRDARRREALAGGQGLVLRPWVESDVSRFVELLDDPRIWKYLPEDQPDSLDEALARDLIHLSNHADHHEVRAIESDGIVVGQVRMLFEGPNHSAFGEPDGEISYWIGRLHWGRGIIGRVIPLYTYLGLRKRTRLSSIFARVHRDNLASRRALMRAGYRFEGEWASALDDEPEIWTYRFFREEYFFSAEAKRAGSARIGAIASSRLRSGAA